MLLHVNEQCDDLVSDMPRDREDLIRSDKATYEVNEIEQQNELRRSELIWEQIGKGSFGAVYHVVRTEDSKELAMKCESFKVKKQILKHEARVLMAIAMLNSPHFISFEDRGKISGRFLFIIFRLVGKNLWDLRMEMPEKKFTMGTSLKAAEQTLAGIRDLHRCGYIHRDIKPPNFAIGREEDGTSHTIFILDFGLCRRYRTAEKDIRLPRQKTAFRGTTRYASISTLNMKDQSRKDDIESWWYMVLEWMICQLPWKHCKGSDREEVKKYKEQLRIENNLKMVLEGTPVRYMKNILLYLDSLNYDSIPDYDYVYNQLDASIQAYCLKYNDPPDWDLMVEYKGPRYEKGLDYNMQIKNDL